MQTHIWINCDDGPCEELVELYKKIKLPITRPLEDCKYITLYYYYYLTRCGRWIAKRYSLHVHEETGEPWADEFWIVVDPQEVAYDCLGESEWLPPELEEWRPRAPDPMIETPPNEAGQQPITHASAQQPARKNKRGRRKDVLNADETLFLNAWAGGEFAKYEDCLKACGLVESISPKRAQQLANARLHRRKASKPPDGSSA
jgi:hypothetical protein